MSANQIFQVIYLAGGVGTRMGAALPKQYLPISHKPLALYGFEVFASMPEVMQMVVVCEPKYQNLFREAWPSPKLQFANPGPRRQDSVYNGLEILNTNGLVCIHDSARPLIDVAQVRSVVQIAASCGAAVIGVKVRSTIKICNEMQDIVETPNRALLWEVQTPQVIQSDLLKEGFAWALSKQLTVTDDVSLVELIGKPVKVVEGSYANVKVTTPEDLIFVQNWIDKYTLPMPMPMPVPEKNTIVA